MLTQRDVVVDPVLSNVSIKYTNEQFVWNRVMPTFPVGKQSGKYYKYDKANLRPVETERAAGSPANEVGFGLSTDSFYAEDYALKEFVDDQVREQADQALNPLTDATEDVTERLIIGAEKTLATTMAATGTITQNTTLSGTDQWSDFANSDPIGDVRTAMQTVQKAILKRPNTLLLSKPVFDQLQDHTDIIDRIKYSQLAATTEDLLARIFGVDKVIVADAIENTAHEGATDSLDYIWGKHAWVLYISPQRRLKTITFGWTFTWKDRVTKRWRDEDREGTYVRVNWNYDQKIVAAEAAYLIKDSVA